MGDFASPLGGGAIVGLDDIPRDVDAYYRLSQDAFLDLSSHSGVAVVDARGNGQDLRIETGKGDDVILASGGDDRITAGKGDDAIEAGGGDDRIEAGNGDDTVRGGDGDDRLLGEKGDDLLAGRDGDDVADGGEGDDLLFGGAGRDSLFGGADDDLLEGGRGADLLVGGKGDDTILGGGDDDLLLGGRGEDSFVFDSDFGHDTLADFGEGDQIWLARDINGSGITAAADLAPWITGGVSSDGGAYTLIRIGEDSIRIEGVDKDDFLSNLNAWVKIV
jgi:Ca2+-binding RTX toxin-like protein